MFEVALWSVSFDLASRYYEAIRFALYLIVYSTCFWADDAVSFFSCGHVLDL